MTFPFYAMVALLFTVLLVKGLIPLALSIGFVDRPGGRKNHYGEIPLVGGVAMFFAYFGVLAFGPELPGGITILLASLMIIAVGLADDRYGLSPSVRFIAQIAATLVLILDGGMLVVNLGDLLFSGAIGLGILAVPFTVFGAVGFMNAMNMADGMDGLAGGLALIAVLAMTGLSWDTSLTRDVLLLLVLAAVLIGFLAFNVRTPWRTHASVFMGDGGSMFLGLLLAWLLIRLSQGNNAVMTPVTALWLVAMPLFDTVSVMLRRLLKGHSPFVADRQHLHHLLQAAGYSVFQATSIILGLAAGFALVGVVGYRLGIPEGIMFIGFMLLFSTYFLALSYASIKLSFRNSSRSSIRTR